MWQTTTGCGGEMRLVYREINLRKADVRWHLIPDLRFSSVQDYLGGPQGGRILHCFDTAEFFTANQLVHRTMRQRHPLVSHNADFLTLPIGCHIQPTY